MIQRLNQSEVQEMLVLLSMNFGIKPPTLRWSNRIRRAHVRAGTIINMGPRDDYQFPAEAVVLHEFAHVLSHVRCKQNTGFWLPNREVHGPAFRGALLQSIDAWTGGKVEQYPWDKEYKNVRKWFAQR